MEDPTRNQLLNTVARVCVEHGFDCTAFVALMRAGFNVAIESPEEAQERELTRFLFAGLKWACPPRTAVMEKRRKEAEQSWACWLELNEERVRPTRRPAA